MKQFFSKNREKLQKIIVKDKIFLKKKRKKATTWLHMM